MFEGDSADMCAGTISASVNGAPRRGSCVRRPPSVLAEILGIFFFSCFLVVLLVTTTIQNHRRGCRRVKIFAWAPKKIIKNLGKK